MYRCENCKRTFARFVTPGQCPHCGVWASVRCTSCGYSAEATRFVDNGDRCPQCGKHVVVPGSQTTGAAWREWLVWIVLVGAYLLYANFFQ